MSSFKRKLFDILEGHAEGPHARLFAFAMMGFIILNVIAVVMDSVETLAQRYAQAFWRFEIFSVAVFTIEYVCRLWACTTAPRFRDALRGRFRFILTPLAMVDLFAIAPFYLSATVLDLRFLRLLRLFRLVRVFKLGHYSEAGRTLRRVFGAKKEELAVSVLTMLC